MKEEVKRRVFQVDRHVPYSINTSSYRYAMSTLLGHIVYLDLLHQSQVIKRIKDFRNYNL